MNQIISRTGQTGTVSNFPRRKLLTVPVLQEARLPDYFHRKLTLPGFRHRRVGQKPCAARQPILRGHTNQNSDDGYLARFTLGAKSVEKVEVLPIAGKGQPTGRTGQPYDPKLFQPFLMEGSTAQQLLEGIRSRSAALDTPMVIDRNKGVITIPPPASK